MYCAECGSQFVVDGDTLMCPTCPILTQFLRETRKPKKEKKMTSFDAATAGMPPSEIQQLLAITEKAMQVFGCEIEVEEWMVTMNSLLGSHTPMRMMQTKEGRNKVEELLDSLIPSSGKNT